MSSVADLVVTHIDTYWDPAITPKPKIAKVIATPLEKTVGESILVELLNQRWEPVNDQYANEVCRLAIRIYTNKTDTRLTAFANEIDRIFGNYTVSGYDINTITATDDVSERQRNSFTQVKTAELTRLSVYRGTAVSATPPDPPGWGVPANYIIFKIGSTIYAKNGTTGIIDYSGTDATTVIQNAVNTLTPGRTWEETVVLKGDLGTVGDIIVPSYTRIQGINAKLSLKSGATAIFKQSAQDVYGWSFDGIEFVNPNAVGATIAIYPFYYDGSWRHAYDLRIKNCKFSHFFKAIEGIASRAWVENNYFTDNDFALSMLAGGGWFINKNLIFISNATNGRCIYIVDVASVQITDNHLSGGTGGYQAGIQIETAASGIIIKGNTFQSLSLAGVLLCITNRAGTVYGVEIADNFFQSVGYGTTSYDGMVIAGSNRVDGYVFDVNIVGNIGYSVQHIFGIGTPALNIPNKLYVHGNRLSGGWKGFVMYGNNYDVTMKHNSMALSSTPVTGTGVLRAFGNAGYVTENSGTSIGTGAQETIPHGLASTPNRVYLTANDAGITQLNENAAADATNIYPICTSGKKYTWRAEKV